LDVVRMSHEIVICEVTPKKSHHITSCCGTHPLLSSQHQLHKQNKK
jgi:hypothetical protein